MKTLKILLVVVFAVFLNSAMAQVTSITFGSGDKFMAFSPNGEYKMVAYDDPSDNAEVYVYQSQADGTSDLVDYYVVPKGDTGNAGVNIFQRFMTVSNNGNSYIAFHDTWINGISHSVLMKNGVEMSGVTPGLPRVIDGYVYVLDGNSNQFYKIDEFTDVVQWNVFISDGIDIITKNNDVYVTDFSGSLSIYDGTNGANLGIIKSGQPGNRYKFSDDGSLTMYSVGNNTMHKFDGTDYTVQLAETDLPERNLFQEIVIAWISTENGFCGLTNDAMIGLSEDFLHGSKIPVYDGGYGDIVTGYASHDYFEYFTVQGNTVHMININLPSEDPANIATVNTGHSDIVAGFNGSKYDEENDEVIDGYAYQHLMVFNDNVMPIVGDIPDATWYNTPSGYEYYGSFPIRAAGDKLIFDTQFREISNHQHVMDIRVEVRSVINTVLGIDSSTITDELSMYPNPATDRLTIKYSQGIENIQIVDLLGKTVFSKKYQGFDENQTLDINNLDAGTYFVRIDGLNTTKKLLVK